MARIRSIHPGIYTDEAWASVSIAARWFAKGLCTEADDNGTFEWKPITLKMRIFPADTVSVPDLLAELVEAGIVMQFEADGRALGSIKNFCKFQRPRKPKAWFPSTTESRAFAAVGDHGPEDDDTEAGRVTQKSEPANLQIVGVPQKSEKSPQMEDGGGRREEEEVNATASTSGASECADVFDEIWKVYRHEKGRSSQPKSRQALACIPTDIHRLLPGAVVRMLREGKAPPNGYPALEKWLADERWRDWITPAAEPLPSQRFPGPAEVRAAFVKEMGDAWVKKFIDPAGWQDVPDRGLIPRNGYAAKQIITDARGVLQNLSLSLIEQARTA